MNATREQAEGIVTMHWPNIFDASRYRAMVDAITAALEEKDLEIERLTEIERLHNALMRRRSMNPSMGGNDVCETELLNVKEQLAEAVALLTQLVSDLPTRRDWLNPDLERAIRTFVRQHANKTVDTHAEPL